MYWKLDKSKVEIDKDTQEIIDKLQFDCQFVWDEWQVTNSEENEFQIDFHFFCGSKAAMKRFEEYMLSKECIVKVKKKWTLIFRGYEITVSLNRGWNFESFKEMIYTMAVLAQQLDCILEGYGAFTQ